MAVEARHLSFFPSRPLTNRELMMGYSVNEGNPTTAIFNNNINGIGYVAPAPLSGTTTDTLQYPIYYNSVIAEDSLPAANNAAAVTSRKRSRPDHSLASFPAGYCQYLNNVDVGQSAFSFLGEDMSLRIQHQQFEMDQFISQHTEKVKMEIEERRRRHAKRILLAAVEQGAGVMKKIIMAREEEIVNIGKLNWALEEKVKSLYMENQIWRDLAQTNEATVNTLRGNLEQVLLQAVRTSTNDQVAVADHHLPVDHDQESCCAGSNNNINIGEDQEVEGGRRPREDQERMCRKCCMEEASVLLLPCRHLCLCRVCGSCVHVCPVCKATKNASVHINLST